MNLDEAQKKTVTAWIKEGLKLSDIQKRIGSEFGITFTYMEVRFLVDDLKLTPKDVDPPKPAVAAPTPAPPSPPAPGTVTPTVGSPAPPAGGVSVKLDEIARPGTIASGRVTFSDGNSAEWYLDQTGRLGLLPQQQGYRPPPQDLQTFQSELQNQLARLGF